VFLLVTAELTAVVGW